MAALALVFGWQAATMYRCGPMTRLTVPADPVAAAAEDAQRQGTTSPT